MAAEVVPQTLRPDVAAWVCGDDGAAPAVDARDAPGLARRRASIARQVAELQKTFDLEVEALTLWHEAEARRLKDEAARIDIALQALLQQQREATGRKTLRLPYGVTVSSRTVPATYKWDALAASNAALVRFLGKSSDYVAHEPSVRWGSLKADLWATSAGQVCLHDEALPAECGVTYEPAHEVESVKVEGDAP